jgi:hypothetical protein
MEAVNVAMGLISDAAKEDLEQPLRMIDERDGQHRLYQRYSAANQDGSSTLIQTLRAQIIDGLAPKSPSSSPLRGSSSMLLGTPPKSSSVRASAASPHRASAASAPGASSPSIDQRIEAALVAELKSGGISRAFDLIESKKSSGVRQTQLNKAYLIVGLAAIMSSSLHNSQKRENAVRALGLMTESSERRKLQGYITRLDDREKLATVQDSIRRELPNGPFKSSLN